MELSGRLFGSRCQAIGPVHSTRKRKKNKDRTLRQIKNIMYFCNGTMQERMAAFFKRDV